MSRRNKKKKGNHLRNFKSRVICPKCSSDKMTVLNRTRNIFECTSCEHKFIYDEGVYDTLESKQEQKEISEEEEIVATPSGDSLDDFFESMRL